MAIAQTGSVLQFQPNVTTETGTASSTITVPADATFVVVGVATYGGSANFIDALTFTKGGVDTAMTKATPAADASTSFFMGALFYMVNPDTGSNKSLKWDWLGASTDRPLFSVTFWNGVDTSSPVRDADAAQAASAPFTTPTLTAQTGDKIIAWANGYTSTGGVDGNASTWSNLTELSDVTNSGNSDGAWATGDPTGNVAVALSTESGWDDGGISAIVVKPAADAWPPTPSGTRLQVHRTGLSW